MTYFIISIKKQKIQIKSLILVFLNKKHKSYLHMTDSEILK